ncbi:MAG: aminotransferase class V-fold PLP-dependent enzyme, partial [Chloroflexi bacterium]|nr:aminotransferase class V-fold PLP-dependent enzyme [Chloroflexota bacterium]
MKYGRVYNFSAGPSMLPEAVLEEVQIELLNYQGSGMSVMEMSHRSKVFEDILHEAEKDLRELMNIPDNYKVLFIQGGGTLQFAMVPMNLMKNGVADYVNTGAWSKKAISEAKKFGKVNIIASSEDRNFT